MEFLKKKSIYLQIGDYICEQILIENWKENDKIPSVREMAINLEVNPNTVMRTYMHLEEKKIICKQRGIGYFVAKDAYKNTIKLKRDIFLSQELPAFFKTVNLLKLNFKEIQKQYQQKYGVSDEDK